MYCMNKILKIKSTTTSCQYTEIVLTESSVGICRFLLPPDSLEEVPGVIEVGVLFAVALICSVLQETESSSFSCRADIEDRECCIVLISAVIDVCISDSIECISIGGYGEENTLSWLPRPNRTILNSRTSAIK